MLAFDFSFGMCKRIFGSQIPMASLDHSDSHSAKSDPSQGELHVRPRVYVRRTYTLFLVSEVSHHAVAKSE